MNKKITILVIIVCTLVVGIGVSLAYFAVNNQNDGNETNLNVTTCLLYTSGYNYRDIQVVVKN